MSNYKGKYYDIIPQGRYEGVKMLSVLFEGEYLMKLDYLANKGEDILNAS